MTVERPFQGRLNAGLKGPRYTFCNIAVSSVLAFF